MRIGVDLRLPTYQMGGISQYAIYLLGGLAELAADDEFLIFHSRKETRSFLPGDPRFARRTLWTPCHHRIERYALATELAPARLDVFHSPDFIPPAGGATRRVITVHDLTFLRYPEFLTAESRRYYNDQIRWAVEQADAISADSEATRQDLVELVGAPPERVTTIHLAANPVYTAPVSPDETAATLHEYSLQPGFILHVGTLEPRKNIPTLLRAYKRWRDETGRTNALLLVGGRGWLYDEIFAAIREQGLEESVRHVSGVSDARLAHFYRAASVLVAPSFYEGFGLPALEAMHAGCPVIASDCGSLPEVVGEAGMLLDPADDLAWTAALESVIGDEAVAVRMRAAGLVQAARFTWRKTAEATLRLYHGE